jgi:serine/threonine protein kinase/Tol biopolymer transport system component
MKSERWARIEALFHAARELQGKDRTSFLDQQCGADDSMRHKVELLLASDEQAGGFLNSAVAAKAISSLKVSIAAGTRFGPYEILAPIGAGGLGEVYRAHDPRLRRDVAVKVIQALVPDGAAWERFQREAHTASALSHPNICAVYDVGEANDQPFLVMELLDGVTLSAHIGERGLEPGAAMAIARQIADALDAAHAKGVVHRDIKPGNVMINARGHVKVLDFGLAMQASMSETDEHRENSENPQDLTQDRISIAGTVTGTPAYMAPEVLQGARADARSDLWAFGVTLYQMLTGRLPFTGTTVYEMSSAIVRDPAPPLPANLPAGLRAIVERCLAKQPEGRYQSASEVRQALDALEPLSVPAGISRRTWLLSAGAAAGVAVAAGTLGQRLWRAYAGQADTTALDPFGGATPDRLTNYPGDEFNAAISPDGKFAAYIRDSGDGKLDAWIESIDSGPRRNITNGLYRLTTGRNIRGVGFSKDGSHVWFVQRDGPGFKTFLVPLASDAAPTQFVEGASLAWSPDADGRLVYHIDGDPVDRMYIADSDGGRPWEVFRDPQGAHCHFPIWSPEGDFIYFVKAIMPTEEMDIWRIGTSPPYKEEPVTRRNRLISHLAWLDSNTLIFTSMADDSSAQWLYRLDVSYPGGEPQRVFRAVGEEYLSVAVSGGSRRRLIATMARPDIKLYTLEISDKTQAWKDAALVKTIETRATSPCFGPDYLLFLSYKGTRDGLWKLTPGEAPRMLWDPREEGGIVAPPAVSPNGKRICFSYRKGGRTGLYLMDAEGQGIGPLATTLEVRGAASWSPDNDWVAVAANANDGRGTRIFKVPVSGGKAIPLSDALSYDPLWSPDGAFILYSERPIRNRTPLKAVTPNREPWPLRPIELSGNPRVSYRFLPKRSDVIVTLEVVVGQTQEFHWVGLETKATSRKLATLEEGSRVRNLDVSPDGKQIVFDRVVNNSDIVWMNLS